MHRIAEPSLTQWPVIPFGAWRLWDAAVSWANLEPEREQWDFSRLDQLVDLAEKNDIELLLTLGLTPRWASARPGDYSAYRPGYSAEPKNMRYWRTYVRKVATRYQGRIRAYEIWNEPNLKAFFSGTPEKMVELAAEAYRIIKEIDPGALVVSPSSGGGGPDSNGLSWLNKYLDAGGGGYADIIGYHFYVPSDPPESMLSLIEKVREVVNQNGLGHKPLWNTEAGWTIQNRQKAPDGSDPSGGLDQITASSYVVRALVLNRFAGVERFYWYAWDNYLMGLVEPDGRTLKPSGHAYGVTYRWLTDSLLQDCAQDARAIWVCGLERRGRSARIVWRSEGMAQWILPADWERAEVSDLQGRRWTVGAQGLVVGSSPVLVERSP